MAIVKVKPSEQIILDRIGNDIYDVLADGAQVQPATNYVSSVYPIPDYPTLVPNPSQAKTQGEDGFKGQAIPLIRHIGPISHQAIATTLNTSYSPVLINTLYSVTLPETFEVTRKAQIAVQFSGYVNAPNVGITYWLEINGVTQLVIPYFFNVANDHRILHGTWIVDLPVGTVNILLKETHTSASFLQNTNDFINLTLIG